MESGLHLGMVREINMQAKSACLKVSMELVVEWNWKRLVERHLYAELWHDRNANVLQSYIESA